MENDVTLNELRDLCGLQRKRLDMRKAARPTGCGAGASDRRLRRPGVDHNDSREAARSAGHG